MSNQEKPSGPPSKERETLETPVVRREPLRFEARKLKEFLDKQHKEGKMPKIEFDFYFSVHNIAEDYENIDKLFQEADIYIPEQASGASPQLEIALNLLSQGAAGVTSFGDPANEFSKALLEKIYNSKKIIAIADVPLGHDTTRIRSHMVSRVREAKRAGATYSQHFHVGVEEWNKQQILREEYILTKIGRKLKEIFQAHPELKEKEKVNVLFSIGSDHVTMYHALKKAGIETKREFSRKPYLYSYFRSGFRKVLFKKGAKIDNRHLNVMAVEEWLLDEIMKNNAWKGWRGDEGTVALAIILGQLSEDEFTKILYKEIDFGDLVMKLQSRGIIFPTTDAEADALIEEYAPELKARTK